LQRHGPALIRKKRKQQKGQFLTGWVEGERGGFGTREVLCSSQTVLKTANAEGEVDLKPKGAQKRGWGQELRGF